MILILKGFDVLVLVLFVPFFVLFLGFVSFWFAVPPDVLVAAIPEEEVNIVAALENEGDNTLCFGRMIKRTGSENVFDMYC